MDAIECMADAMMQREGWKPDSRSYRNRNPLNLRRPKPAVDTDEQGFRRFELFLNGYIAGISDLRSKFTGHNDHGIRPDSTLRQLIECWAPASDGNDPHSYAEFVAEWMTKSLGKPITQDTLLQAIWSGNGLPALK